MSGSSAMAEGTNFARFRYPREDKVIFVINLSLLKYLFSRIRELSQPRDAPSSPVTDVHCGQNQAGARNVCLQRIPKDIMKVDSNVPSQPEGCVIANAALEHWRHLQSVLRGGLI